MSEPENKPAQHRPDCSCSECWHKRIPTSRAAFREMQKGQDPFERERGIRRAESEYEARIYREGK